MSNVFDIGGGEQQPQRVNVNLNEAQDITCDKCGGHFFYCHLIPHCNVFICFLNFSTSSFFVP